MSHKHDWQDDPQNNQRVCFGCGIKEAFIHQTVKDEMVARITIKKGSTECVNLFSTAKGSLKAITYKTIDGLCYQIRRANKTCKKFGFRTKIEVILPIPEAR